MMEGPRIAPAGAIWVCSACGKTSKDRYGDKNSSWDESCMMNSFLCHEVQRPDDTGKLMWTLFPSTVLNPASEDLT